MRRALIVMLVLIVGYGSNNNGMYFDTCRKRRICRWFYYGDTYLRRQLRCQVTGDSPGVHEEGETVKYLQGFVPGGYSR